MGGREGERENEGGKERENEGGKERPRKGILEKGWCRKVRGRKKVEKGNRVGGRDAQMEGERDKERK